MSFSSSFNFHSKNLLCPYLMVLVQSLLVIAIAIRSSTDLQIPTNSVWCFGFTTVKQLEASFTCIFKRRRKIFAYGKWLNN